MPTMPNVHAAALASILVLAGGVPAGATVLQQASVLFGPTAGGLVRDDDSILVSNSGDIDRALLATIGVPFTYGASVSVGIFGTFGMQAFQRTGGQLETSVGIQSDEFANLTAQPARARANFIIDGGMLGLSASPGSTIEYVLTIEASTAPIGPFIPFQSAGTLTAVDFDSTTFTTRGDDIGAAPDGSTGVRIPLSFQEVDLGLIQPGETLNLRYDLTIRSDLFAVEGAAWEFSDPLSLLPPDAQFFPLAVTFEPVAQTVPEPATLSMLLAGVGSLVWLGRRPRSPHAFKGRRQETRAAASG